MPRFINWTAGPGGSLEPYRFPPLFDWDFTQQSPGALVLPTGLTFARASSGHTVQTSTNGLIVGGAIASNDVGCVGRLDSAHGYGLRLAPLRTNLLLNNRDQSAAGWAAGFQNTQTYNAAAGPDGSVVATRNATLSGGYSRYQVLTLTVGQTYAASAWIRAVSGTSEYRVGLIKDSGSWTYAGGPGQTVDTNWVRKSLVRGIPAGGATNVFFSFDGVARATPSVVAAQAADLYSDLGQVELGLYPTCPIITSGSTATRAQERLTINQTEARALVTRGRVGFYFRFRPTAAITVLNPSTEGMLLKSVGLTPAFSAQILGNSQQLVVSDGVNQSITGTSVFSWAVGDLVEIVLEMGAGKSTARWRLNGGAVTPLSFTGLDQSLSALDASLTGIDLLCSSTSVIMPSFVERIVPFVPGHAPF